MSLRTLLKESVVHMYGDQSFKVEVAGFGNVILRSTRRDSDGKSVKGNGTWEERLTPRLARELGLALIQGAYLEENDVQSIAVDGYFLSSASGLESDKRELWYSLGQLLPKPVTFFSNLAEDEVRVLELGIHLNSDNCIVSVEARSEDEELEFYDEEWDVSKAPKEVFDLALALVGKALDAKLLY